MKLLIVEDDRDTSEGVCEYFEEAGYEVTPAYDGEQALKLVAQNSYDLILLDVMLPKLTGLAVLHELRKTSNVPVIMLTAIGDEYTQIASFDGMADDYVTKPFSITLLEKRVEALLRRGEGNIEFLIHPCEDWLPASGFEFAGHEFEYNNEKMFNENPHYIDLYITVKDKLEVFI